ncbi:ribosomal protein S18-alanine N-acetyltransferase [Calditerrivibrio nitroreducens]|uniref:[Ribosomal protein bS18]-alanine N-acetyltransferase n=1 Tax=Calditerrivibrio nitroreducens (strain DSM 19672 / NBRC 101217 / Yu37-1) TaxID=768670 RepID=E4TH95_CALNY|nr:ribosomal protein S18-alanine N-acetyltransferase [Calditerrivibrio nitroreducens]ADR18789.1 ribosomal-protein-alanine acetyltransferase [Calditerrivibrio nitroreducens DSM 19672]
MIRKAVEEDLKDILEIEQEVYDNPWGYESFLHELNNNVAKFLIYEEDIIKGYLIYWEIYNDLKMINELEVVNIAVKKDYQSKGIARRLMSYMIANSLKPFVCFLDVRIDNLPAINLYKSLGFEVIGKRKNFYGLNKDAYTMRLNCEVEYDKV